MFGDIASAQIGVVGLGYVGLPLAVVLADEFDVIGFDVSRKRVSELHAGEDTTREVSTEQLIAATSLKFTNEINGLKDCNIYIVAVPTPVDQWNQPDLSSLISVSREIGNIIDAGDLVIFESTVYPGVTEEICAPEIAAVSNLKVASENDCDKSVCFFVGYSPERVNPGDPERRIQDIVKVVSGCTQEAAHFIDEIYSKVIPAGTHRVNSIRIAEAAKVIENIQRDVNIALMNELSILFDKMGISTQDVLKASNTKWNFLPFRPGLVGGHCIGVDPYYLTHKAKELNYHAEVILAGRRINETMPSNVAERVIKAMIGRKIEVLGSRVLILGATFKQNCGDTRNSKVFELIRSINAFGCLVDVYDPFVDTFPLDDLPAKLVTSKPDKNQYDAVVLAVAHDEFCELGVNELREFGRSVHILFDVMSHFDSRLTDGSL